MNQKGKKLKFFKTQGALFIQMTLVMLHNFSRSQNIKHVTLICISYEKVEKPMISDLKKNKVLTL